MKLTTKKLVVRHYWKRYGRKPQLVTEEQMITALVIDEGLPKWSAITLVSLATSNATVHAVVDEHCGVDKVSRAVINSEFYITAQYEIESVEKVGQENAHA